MGRRSSFKRRRHDAYQTIDPRAVEALLPHLPDVRFYAEPCCGTAELIKLFNPHGLVCVHAFDLLDGVDALETTDFGSAQAIITNPPWTRLLLHPLITHLQKQLPTWLLFDADWAHNKHAGPFLDCCSDIVSVGRLCWIEGTRQTGKDNASWYRFDARHQGGPRFHGRR